MFDFEDEETRQAWRDLILSTNGSEPCFDPTLVGEDGVLSDSPTDIYVEGWSKRGHAAPKLAQELCAPCHVKDKCAAYAIKAKEPYGVWGGTLPSDRGYTRGKTRVSKPYPDWSN